MSYRELERGTVGAISETKEGERKKDEKMVARNVNWTKSRRRISIAGLPTYCILLLLPVPVVDNHRATREPSRSNELRNTVWNGIRRLETL